MGGEEGLGQQTLVQVEANQVSRGEEAHHDTQGIEAQEADGQVISPPGAHANEEQEVNGREGRGESDACGEKDISIWKINSTPRPQRAARRLTSQCQQTDGQDSAQVPQDLTGCLFQPDRQLFGSGRWRNSLHGVVS